MGSHGFSHPSKSIASNDSADVVPSIYKCKINEYLFWIQKWVETPLIGRRIIDTSISPSPRKNKADKPERAYFCELYRSDSCQKSLCEDDMHPKNQPPKQYGSVFYVQDNCRCYLF